MGIFNFFGVDVEVDLSGKSYEEDVRLGERYNELCEQTKDIDYDNMTDEEEALDDARSDVYCKLVYERGVQVVFPPHEEAEESKPWWKVW